MFESVMRLLAFLPYGCKFGDKCMFGHQEVDTEPDKKPRNIRGHGSDALLKNSKQLEVAYSGISCISQKVQYNT